MKALLLPLLLLPLLLPQGEVAVRREAYPGWTESAD